MRISFRLFLFIITLVFVSSAVFAQQSFEIKGAIIKKGTNQRLPLVAVTNIRSKQMILSGDMGEFSIKANWGDTLSFTLKDYSEQRLPVTSAANMLIYLQPTIELQEVTVHGGKTRADEMNEVMKSYKSKGLYYNGKPPVLASIASPLTGLHELFSKDAAHARHFNAYMQRENEQTAISKKYNKSLVKRITNLPDEDVENFMLIYQPSYDQVQKWNDYDVITYIKDSLEDYKKNGEKESKSVKLNP